MKKKSLALLLSLVALASFSTAYGFTFVPPPSQVFGGFGMTYTVEYECGAPLYNPANLQQVYAPFAPGAYNTDILIHNNQPRASFLYIKILDGYNNLSVWATNPTVKGMVAYRFPIQPDGLLFIDCSQIIAAEAQGKPFSSSFASGLIILSQPGAIVALDVIAAYTVEGIANFQGAPYGVSKDVVVYTGTRVTSVPEPCAPSFAACQNLPP